ncbi:hypothetical protein ACIQHY_34155, partial [Streptomyces sp. NPDC092359]|uniref:hypothetical protein n=1 Tax=Streptomyces sp. NPDC092359 TaxID=3366014 RepID=UPI0038131EE8
PHRREHHLLARPDITGSSPHDGMKQREKTTSKGLGDRFVHLTNVHDVIEVFATKTDVDAQTVRDILGTPDMARRVEEHAMQLMPAPMLVQMREPIHMRGRGRFECTTAPTSDISDGQVTDEGARSVVARGWINQPTARLDSVDKMKAHSIGDHVWCSATAHWTLSGIAELRNRQAAIVACSWATRVLLSTTQPEAVPTLLRSESPLPVAPSEMNRLPSLEFQETGPTPATRLEAHLDALLHQVSSEDKSDYRVRRSYQRLLDDLRRDLLDDDDA